MPSTTLKPTNALVNAGTSELPFEADLRDGRFSFKRPLESHALDRCLEVIAAKQIPEGQKFLESVLLVLNLSIQRIPDARSPNPRVGFLDLRTGEKLDFFARVINQARQLDVSNFSKQLKTETGLGLSTYIKAVLQERYSPLRVTPSILAQTLHSALAEILEIRSSPTSRKNDATKIDSEIQQKFDRIRKRSEVRNLTDSPAEKALKFAYRHIVAVASDLAHGRYKLESQDLKRIFSANIVSASRSANKPAFK